MDETRHRSRLKYAAALCLIVGIGFLVTGCDSSIKDGGKAAKEESTAVAASQGVGAEQSSGRSLSATDTVLADAIESCRDLIGLQETVAELGNPADLSPEITAVIGRKRAALRSGVRTHKISNALDLVAYRWKYIGTEKYQFQWLFEVKGPIEHNCSVYAYARVDLSHRRLLDEEFRERGLVNWTLGLKGCPPTSKWTAGEHVLAKSREISAKDIPYNVTFNLFYKDADGKSHPYGESVRLGWVADLGD